MSFEDIKAEINLLLVEMENQPQDLHELQEKVHEKLRELRAFGMPLSSPLCLGHLIAISLLRFRARVHAYLERDVGGCGCIGIATG